MKSAFSNTWNASTQTRKQRKYQFNAPDHIRGKFLSAPLSKELQKKYNTQSLRVRKGDKVKIMRGQFKGLVGAVEETDNAASRIIVQKAEIAKKDGSKVKYPIHASNVEIVEIKTDKKRVN